MDREVAGTIAAVFLGGDEDQADDAVSESVRNMTRTARRMISGGPFSRGSGDRI
ncbi:hypothetical protein [Rugosimonospora africana]|uniref:hypothetical protein n=1 Tax=Rugosimonospora africana TaxID=556532 RepID=UPI0019418DCE|nr:hypothetical protein [Rugosimonospora africana]